MSEELRLAADAIRMAQELKIENDRLIKNNRILTIALCQSLDVIDMAIPDPRMADAIKNIRYIVSTQQ